MEALIDGDIVAYRCGFAGQHNHHQVMNMEGEVVFETDLKREATALVKKSTFLGATDMYELYTSIEIEPIENILHSVKLMITEILDTIPTTKYQIFLTGKTNFRKELSTSYKANRDPNKKPKSLADIEKYLVEQYGAIISDGEEADDLLGIHQTKDTIICTIDKDLDMIPGWHYNIVNKNKYVVEYLEATQTFYKQILQGDTADNIEGMYKLTGKRCIAKTYLAPIDKMSQEGDMWTYVTGVLKGVPEDVVINNSRLLWMRREEGQVWQPPNE